MEEPTSTIAAELVALGDRSARGIATAISRSIRGGHLEAGQKLPTVRALAKALGTSPTTVSEGWQLLSRMGVIEARGRLGTFVRSDHRPLGSRRYRTITQRASAYRLDLSTGVPDPDLLPDMRRALERVSRRNLTTSYLDDPILPALEEFLRSAWPFPADVMTVVDGAMDALDRILTSVVRLGDLVAVEDPAFPPLLDLLDHLGAVPIAVDVDEDGMMPSSLCAALAQKPTAVVVQPRAHNPTGASMTSARAHALADLLLSHPDTVVVEDDHSGEIAWADPVSIGEWLPDRTVHIRSFSKSHGPDLRLAAVGGSGAVVAQLVERRVLGPGWSSRLLQSVLLEMLRDAGTRRHIADAREEYRRRRDLLGEAFVQHGIAHRTADGINAWIPVEDERAALLSLAVRGVGVAPGTPFLLDHRRGPHVRVTVGLVGDGHERLAADLAAAATEPALRPRR